MSPVLTESTQARRTGTRFAWGTLAWISVVIVACYWPVIVKLVSNWDQDPDMGHAFFVPLIAGYIAWRKRGEIADKPARPSWWGLPVLLWGALQLYIATLGAELFLTRTSLIVTIVGTVLLLGGREYARIFAFPMFLLLFMVPIPAVIYNQITFPLQLLASRTAENAISMLQIPVIREGNVLELASQKLDVVEACSGIRSLLTLTFLSLVYGYFFEKRRWLRVVLFLSTIPIAIMANAGRVTLTGVIANFKPELAEGLFHEAQGWVIFMVALALLIAWHQLLIRGSHLVAKKHA